MLFNSFAFLVFLPTVFILYWVVFNRNLRLRNFFLLVVSYIFYGWWDWRFLSLIAFSSFIDYLVGIQIGKSDDPKRRKLFLTLSVTTQLGLLGTFKYFDFFSRSFADAFGGIGIQFDPLTLNLILPVGISFYTFQTISYTIDVYRRQVEATKDIIAFFAFVSFFPQLVAGPIERATNLLPQFSERKIIDSESILYGLNRIVYGFFKKVVVADRLAVYVNQVFGDIHNASVLSIAIAVFFFTIQVYADFSGYSDIAVGTARLFGFRLMENFKKPLFSKSVPELWRRWHISLITWFRDYLYIPLGGSRVSKPRWYFNIFITFLLSGLWHGANWPYIAWGAIQGLYIIIGDALDGFRTRLLKLSRLTPDSNMVGLINMVMTFLLFCFSLLVFRVENISHLLVVLDKVIALDFSLNLVQICAGKGPLNLFLSFLSIFILLLSDIFVDTEKAVLNLKGFAVRYNAAYLVVFTFIILLLGKNYSTEFFYFQF